MSVPALKLKPGQQELVGKMIARIKDGDLSSFISPWRNGGYGLSPMNAISGRPYRGWNRFATCMSAHFAQYSSPLWLTEKQATDHGGTIRGGATPIIFCGRYRKKRHSNGPDQTTKMTLDQAAPERTSSPAEAPGRIGFVGSGRSDPGETYGRFVREFKVYNLAQTSGVKLPKKMVQLLDERAARADSWKLDDGLAELRRIIKDANVVPLYYDTYGSTCHYRKNTHEVHVPQQRYFRSELDQWEAVGHEIIHATGHQSLLNRPTLVGLHPRGSDEHCLEEVTAVMGSLFLCQEAGVPVTEDRERNWSAYLKEFKALEILERNPSIFVQALVHADFATQFVLHPDKRPDFIKNGIAPDQFEFEFREFATARELPSAAGVVDGVAVENEMARATAAAEALKKAASPHMEVSRA